MGGPCTEWTRQRGWYLRKSPHPRLLTLSLFEWVCSGRLFWCKDGLVSTLWRDDNCSLLVILYFQGFQKNHQQLLKMIKEHPFCVKFDSTQFKSSEKGEKFLIWWAVGSGPKPPWSIKIFKAVASSWPQTFWPIICRQYLNILKKKIMVWNMFESDKSGVLTLEFLLTLEVTVV